MMNNSKLWYALTFGLTLYKYPMSSPTMLSILILNEHTSHDIIIRGVNNSRKSGSLCLRVQINRKKPKIQRIPKNFKKILRNPKNSWKCLNTPRITEHPKESLKILWIRKDKKSPNNSKKIKNPVPKIPSENQNKHKNSKQIPKNPKSVKESKNPKNLKRSLKILRKAKNDKETLKIPRIPKNTKCPKNPKKSQDPQKNLLF